jgi:hypothetical protein
MESRESTSTARPPWNKGKIVGQKTPFKLKRDLGYPRAAATRGPLPGTRPVQSRIPRTLPVPHRTDMAPAGAMGSMALPPSRSTG